MVPAYRPELAQVASTTHNDERASFRNSRSWPGRSEENYGELQSRQLVSHLGFEPDTSRTQVRTVSLHAPHQLYNMLYRSAIYSKLTRLIVTKTDIWPNHYA